MDRRHLLGIALILASAAGFGSGSLFAQPVYAAGVDWMVLSAWRFLFGATMTWGWLLVSPVRRAGLLALDRRAAFAAVGLGVLYVGNSGTYFAGLETVSPSLAALIVYIYPALVAVLSLRFGRRLEGRRAWFALGLALLGVALSVGGIDPSGAPPVQGLLLIIASPLIYSIWIVLSARLAGERPGVGGDRRGVGGERGAAGEQPGVGGEQPGVGGERRDRDEPLDVGEPRGTGASTASATVLMITTTAIVYWLMTLATGRPVLPGQIPTDAWFGLVGVGVLSTFVAIATFYAGAQLIGAAQAALISTVEPIWTIALAAILFGVALTPVQLVGGGLILVAVVVAQTGPESGRTRRSTVRVADA